MTTFHVKYSSNNSGGVWWLKDKDWENLEKGGWRVHWVKDEPQTGLFAADKKAGRWLGALARSACKNFEASTNDGALYEAESDFESITGQSVYEEGCHCCGQPHYLSVFKSNKNCSCTYYYPELKNESV